MSNGGKKPGLKDLSDLKARLGMLNKGGVSQPPSPAAPAANPFAPRPSVPPAAPTPTPAFDLQADPDAELGGDTAIVRIAPAEPKPAPASAPAPAAAPVAAQPVPAARPAPAPAPRPSGSGAGFALGEDLFAAPQPKPEPVAQPQPAARPAQPARPAAAAFPSAPAPAAAPQPKAGFAHPLHQGAYREAAAPVDLSAAEEEALSSFEGKQAGIKPSLAILMTAVVGLVTLVFGFAIGDVRSKRRQINMQIEASKMVQDRMVPVLNKLNEVAPIIEAMAAMKDQNVDFGKVSAIPQALPDVQAEFILSTPVPLQKELSAQLTRAVGDLNILFRMLNAHRSTTMLDKAELEALAKGDSFAQHKHYAVFSPPPPKPKQVGRRVIPPPPSNGPKKGRVVALVGNAVQGEAEGEGFVIPIRKRDSEKDVMAPVEGITLIPKTDLLSSGRGNVKETYKRRVDELNKQLKKINQYRKDLEDRIKTQASREHVFSI